MRIPQATGDVDLLSMAEGEDWVMRPVLARLCSFESLKNGTVDLADIALLNEALDVQLENEYRTRPKGT